MSAATRIAGTAFVVGAAALLCAALDASTPIGAAVVFFPAMLFSTLFGGWACGAAALVSSTVLFWLTVPGLPSEHPAGATVAAFVAAGAVQFAIAAVARAILIDRERLRVRLLRLVNAAQGFLFVTDAEGHPLEPHSRWTALTGMRWQDYRNRGWLRAVHPDDQDNLPPLERPQEGKSHQAEVRIRDATSDEWRWHRMRIVPLYDRRGQIREWVGTLRDIHDRKLQAQKRDLVISELRHRLKNLMAIVEALAKYSAPRPGTDPGVDEFLKRYSGRLHALTAASDLVLASNRGAIEANAVIRATLAPFMSDLAPRFLLDGPEIELSEEFGGGLALAVHELATNAIKYGALSVPQGTVRFAWTSEVTAEGECIVFDWKEHGGLTPLRPNREGFGTRMIKAVTAREETGSVTIDYDPDGLRCRISFTRPRAKLT